MYKLLTPILFLIGALLSADALTAANGTYRWTDKNGTVQYSDIPPEGVKAEFIRFSSAGKSRSEDNAKKEGGADEAEAAAEGKPEQAKVFDEMEVLPEKDPKLCKQAKANLKALGAARIRITEPDGSKRILTEEEKEVQRDNARKFIDIHC